MHAGILQPGGNLRPVHKTGRPIIGPHGGYESLRCYLLSQIVYDGTVAFCGRCLPRKYRMVEQMTHAARSGKQNIVEGSRVSGTSKKTEIKLVGVARASLEELLEDYRDFLRQNGHDLWTRDHEKAVFIRGLHRRFEARRAEDDWTDQTDRTDPTDLSDPSDPVGRVTESYALYRTYIEEKSPETAANTLVCLIHQCNYLLDRLIRRLEDDFVEQGGFTERLYRTRTDRRGRADRSKDKT